MWIKSLRLSDLRSVESATLELGPGLNLFVGANGAGKTTLLEAAFLLSYGRSFRRGSRDALLRRGASQFTVFAELSHLPGGTTRLGLLGTPGGLEGRLDGSRVGRVADLLSRCAICCFEPGSHELIAGPSEERRAFLDWGLFHVEPEFLDAWRRVQRVQRQRNALLRRGADDADLEVWDLELATWGSRVAQLRQEQCRALQPVLEHVTKDLVPELGAVELVYKAGWRGELGASGLVEALHSRRERDRMRQHTSVGPHRADWNLCFERAPQREHLSRGQEKLVALACMLAQARLFEARRGEWPVFCLDDLASELDRPHHSRLLALLLESGAQLLVTATERIPSDSVGARVFHVEQGCIDAVTD